MSLRGDLKIDRLKRGDLLLRAKDHFKGGPKTVDETMEQVRDLKKEKGTDHMTIQCIVVRFFIFLNGIPGPILS